VVPSGNLLKDNGSFNPVGNPAAGRQRLYHGFVMGEVR
jgi:hypothetical protein